MELFIFARFHARDGEEDAIAAAMRDMRGPVRFLERVEPLIGHPLDVTRARPVT